MKKAMALAFAFTFSLSGLAVAQDMKSGQPEAKGTVRNVEVGKQAVILEDGTGIGDRETIQSVFEHRARERDQLRDVVQVFDAVLPSTRGAAALEELKRRFAMMSHVQ